MRTVIYARFSSALQNSRSIEDQVAVCQERAVREGWDIVGVFTDHAISGAAGIGEAARPGLNALLQAVEAGGVDQVLAEATDRIARHQGDAFAIRERITFAGARLFTLSDGEVTDIMATFRGLMDAQFRKDLGAKIRRGQRGAVAQGRSPAGLAFGYRKANRIDASGNIVRGLRVIDPDQAAIVTRIFAEYVAGESPRAICERLNTEGVPAPRGAFWRASTLHGDRKRCDGMLQNRLYVGELVIARTSKVTDPRTRSTLIRPNDPSTWQVQAVPDLAIVDRATWDAAQALRQRHATGRPTDHRRPRHMLSRLAHCAECGGGWTVIRPDRWGCSRRREAGNSICSNDRTITTDELERRVLSGLQDQMLDPALVEIYVREYHLEHARRSAEIARSGDHLRRAHREAADRVARLVDAVAAGGESFAEIIDALAAAKAERDRLAERIAEIDTLPVVALHPTVIADYRRQVASLNQALASSDAARLEAIPRLRSLIDDIRVAPDRSQRHGVIIEISGRLANMLALATGGKAEVSTGMLSLERVAGIEPA